MASPPGRLRPGWFLSRRFRNAKSVGRSSWSLSVPLSTAILPPKSGLPDFVQSLDARIDRPIRWSVLARRKPRLLFRFVGVFLFRLAERRFCGLLIQEPPRLTRLALWDPPGETCASFNNLPDSAPSKKAGSQKNPAKGASPLWKPHAQTSCARKNAGGYNVLAKRKPPMMYRMVGLFLFRYAERRNCG